MIADYNLTHSTTDIPKRLEQQSYPPPAPLQIASFDNDGAGVRHVGNSTQRRVIAGHQRRCGSYGSENSLFSVPSAAH
jgi:hypothetical protein